MVKIHPSTLIVWHSNCATTSDQTNAGWPSSHNYDAREKEIWTRESIQKICEELKLTRGKLALWILCNRLAGGREVEHGAVPSLR